jgi:hypothetical protein
MVEPEETTVARQRLGKHVPIATDTHVKELLGAVFVYVVHVSNTLYVVKGK